MPGWWGRSPEGLLHVTNHPALPRERGFLGWKTLSLNTETAPGKPGEPVTLLSC